MPDRSHSPRRALLLLWLMLAPSAVAAEPAGSADLEIGRAIGACLEREDPDCAQPWLTELKRRAGTSFTQLYAQGAVDFLRGKFSRADAALTRVATSAIAPPALRPQSAALAAAARASAAATKGFIQRPVAGGRFVIWLQPGPDEVLVPLLDDVLRRAAAALTTRIGPLPASPIAVHIYPKVDTLAAVSGLTITQVQTSGTIALCKYNRLMLTSPRDLFFGYQWADTVAHELVHFLIMKHGGAQVPVWLHEAMARTLETTWRTSAPLHLDQDERILLRRARRRGRFIRLRRMHPTMAALPSQDAAQTAFAEVHHAMIWLLARASRRSPGATFADLITRMGAGTPPIAAVQQWSHEAKFPAPWWAALRRGELLQRGPRPEARRGVRERLRFRRQTTETTEPLSEIAARHVELGDRLLAIDRPLAAVLEYQKARTAGATNNALMLTRLARALLRLRRFTEAKVMLDDAISRHRHHAPLLLLLGQAAEALGDHDAALHWAEEALWINPFDAAIHRLRAKAFLAKGQTEAATQAQIAAEQVTP